MYRPAALALALLTAALPATAHEFWIEPLDYRIAPGENIQAKTLNGEFFEGIEFGYSEPAFRQSGVVAGETRTPLPGVRLAKPAIDVAPAGPGLNVIFHASPVNSLTYENFAKFERFLKGMRLDWALAEHKAKRMPEEGIREAYFRFVKALVAVGDGAGADRSVGMPYELVALDNPYTGGGDIRVQLLLSGRPAAGAPVFVFHRAGGEVEQIDLMTDAEGIVTVPGAPGDYMVNSVHIAPPMDNIRQATRADWMTLWAALNYRIGD